MVGDICGLVPTLFTVAATSVKVAYAGITKKLKVEATEEGLSNFTEAVTRIADAKEAECASSGAVGTEAIARLGAEFKSLSGDVVKNVDEIRDIFGKMLCLSEKTRRVMRWKRQGSCPDSRGPCTCPSVVTCTCHFFACIDPGDILKPILGIDLDTGVGNPSLAFVVDTTNSMTREINSAKAVVNDYMRSEGAGPQCYVLQPFNDLRNGRFDPASK